MKSNTRKITMIGMLCALAFIAVAVCRIPVILFLKYDPKDTVIALGGFIFGPMASLIISTVVSLIEMLTISDTGFIGFIMNVLSSCAFACTAAIIYKKKRTLAGAVTGLLCGCAAMTAIMILWNYLITPLYMETPREAVVKLLIPAFLPFNLLKSVLNAAFTFVLYKPVVGALRRMGYISPESGSGAKRHTGMVIFCAVIIVTCILIIMAMNKII